MKGCSVFLRDFNHLFTCGNYFLLVFLLISAANQFSYFESINVYMGRRTSCIYTQLWPWLVTAVSIECGFISYIGY